MRSEATLDSRTEVRIRRVDNGWIVVGLESNGEDWHVFEVMPEGDPMEQEKLAFEAAMELVVKMVGPGLAFPELEQPKVKSSKKKSARRKK